MSYVQDTDVQGIVLAIIQRLYNVQSIYYFVNYSKGHIVIQNQWYHHSSVYKFPHCFYPWWQNYTSKL